MSGGRPTRIDTLVGLLRLKERPEQAIKRRVERLLGLDSSAKEQDHDHEVHTHLSEGAAHGAAATGLHHGSSGALRLDY